MDVLSQIFSTIEKGADVYGKLVETGIITPAYAPYGGKTEAQHQRQMQLLIEAQKAKPEYIYALAQREKPAWERWLPWVVLGGAGTFILGYFAFRKPRR